MFRNLIAKVAACVGLLTITACATPQMNYVPLAQPFSRPPLNAEVTVSVGEEMLSQGNVITRSGILLRSTVQISGYTLSPGFYPTTGSDQKADFYGFQMAAMPGQANYGVLTRNFLVDPPQSIMIKKGTRSICVVTVFNLYACRDNLSFETTTNSVSTESSFQQTLIYSGRIGDKVNISYREFSGSLARPAFNNDVEYDLSTSSEIAYRGARLKIVRADNASITYLVLSNFNTR